MKLSPLALALLIVSTLVLAGFAPAADAYPVCIGLKASGLGAPHVEFTLWAVDYGAFVHLAGEARFFQSISPPNSLIIHSVSGTAIVIDDSFRVSLTGAGYNLANDILNGTFALLLKADATQNTLTYSRQSLDASSTVVVTGPAELKACP
jgi:hypothetical protein